MLFNVYRNGNNAANQPAAYYPHRTRVAEVEADTAAEACSLAAERVTVYNNQRLDAVPATDEAEAEATIDARVRLV